MKNIDKKEKVGSKGMNIQNTLKYERKLQDNRNPPTILLFTGVFIIAVCWAYKADYSTSEKITLITGFATVYVMGVVVLFSFFDWLFNEKKQKLNVIDKKLLYLYKPYFKALIDFEKKLPPTKKIDNTTELELTFGDIELRTVYELDYNVDQTRIKFLGQPNDNTLSNFIGAVKKEKEKLETERKKYT